MSPIPTSELRAAITGLRQGTGRRSRYSAMLEDAVDELSHLRLMVTDLVCETCNSVGDKSDCECGSIRTPRMVLSTRELEEKIRHLERVIQEFMISDLDDEVADGVAN